MKGDRRDFELSNYSQTTTCEKSKHCAIKKTIFWITQKLNESRSSGPVPYDTAWAARVPKVDDLLRPAYPRCLQWIRDYQKEDGSWGDDYPFLVHSKVLNTFAAILALSQWNQQQDTGRITKGINALRQLAETLPTEETENSVFEMILSGMMDDAEDFALDISLENFEWFSQIGKKRLNQIKTEMITNIPNQYWAFLEAAGKTLNLHPAYYRSEIKRRGLIAAQPSTTAYVLRRARLIGENYPEAEWTLKRLISENNGGLPHLYKYDNFELIHGLDVLIKAGINPIKKEKHVAVKNAVEVLRKRWDTQSGIGVSSEWSFTDQGCAEMASDVLQKTLGMEKEFKALKTKTLKDNEVVGLNNHIRQKISRHTEQNKTFKFSSNFLFDKTIVSHQNVCQKSELFLNGTQSISKYSYIMRQAFESDLNRAELVSAFLEQIVRTQNDDGGWGGQGTSSAEETAYICLTIFLLIKYNSQILHRINFSKLCEFIETAEGNPKENFWCWKVTFSSAFISEVSVAVAKYAVFQMQRLCIMTDVLNKNELDFERVDITDVKSSIFHGYCLRLGNQIHLKDINTDRQQVKDLLTDILEEKCINASLKAAIDVSSEFSYLHHSVKISTSQRLIEMVFVVYLFIIDDVVDEFLPRKNGVEDEVNKFFCVITDILEGKYEKPPEVPVINFPEFTNLMKLLFYARNAFRQNGWDTDNFMKELKKVLYDAYALAYLDFSNKIEPTTHRFLQVHKVSSTLRLLLQHILMIDGISPSAEAENLDLYDKFLDSACKVVRLYADFACVPKDKSIPTYDNYCLRLQLQYKISMQEAVQLTVKKANKEILKMYSLKNMIKNDPKYKALYRDLSLRMKYVENILDGTLIWSLTTRRYKTVWTLKNKRVRHEKKDLTFVRNLFD